MVYDLKFLTNAKNLQFFAGQMTSISRTAVGVFVYNNSVLYWFLTWHYYLSVIKEYCYFRAFIAYVMLELIYNPKSLKS